MRSEKEMLALILSMAQHDERVRAAILSGSRANPQAARDPFQDYDLLLVVTDVNAFVRDRGWIGRFGEIMIMQKPEENDDPPPFSDGRYIRHRNVKVITGKFLVPKYGSLVPLVFA